MSEIALPEPAAWILGDFNSASVVCSQRHPRATEVYTAEQVRQLIAAEREANALKCDDEAARLKVTDGARAALVAETCAAAIRR